MSADLSGDFPYEIFCFLHIILSLKEIQDTVHVKVQIQMVHSVIRRLLTSHILAVIASSVGMITSHILAVIAWQYGYDKNLLNWVKGWESMQRRNQYSFYVFFSAYCPIHRALLCF